MRTDRVQCPREQLHKAGNFGQFREAESPLSAQGEGRGAGDELARPPRCQGRGHACAIRGKREHKALPIHPSYGLESAAHKRSDSSRCDPKITREQAEQALREAIQLGNVSTEFQDNFPAYVWGRVDGQFYAARLINREAGHYKAWPIEEAELPVDRDGRLGAGPVDDA